jgi:4-amino-4-deoxy-L-arabinose transferase-like glycosyltransferase
VIFFSASHSKLPGYVLPAIPAMGLLVARAFVSMTVRYAKSFGWCNGVVLTLLLVVAFAESVTKIPTRSTAEFATSAARVAVMLALANFILALNATKGKNGRHSIFAALAVVPILTVLLVSGRLLPRFFNGDPSGRTLAREVQRRGIPTSALSVSGMKRGMQYGLSFYLHQEIKEWDAKSETGGYLLTASKDCGRVVGAEFFCEAQPFNADGTGRFLYLVIPIAGGK